jgi:hypothetical protein
MRDTPSTNQASGNSTHTESRCCLRRPVVLWQLHGATDDLRGLAFATSFGYALGLELDTELVLLHLQPDLERLVAYSDRIHAALCAQGWQTVEQPSSRRSGYAAR